MGAIVEFNYSAWQARYPEFSQVTQTQAEAYFAEASLYHANDGSGPVNDATAQLALLNMLTAHIAYLYSGTATQPASQLVGRIGDASEGSVAVRADMGVQPGSAAWFQQSKYGASYWAATMVYRTMRYRRPRFCGPFGGFIPLG